MPSDGGLGLLAESRRANGKQSGPPVSEHHLAAQDLLPCAEAFGLSGSHLASLP